MISMQRASTFASDWLAPNVVLAPLVVLYLVYVVLLWRNIARSQVKVLPKWLWAVVVAILSPPIGGLIYLVGGRAQPGR